MLLARSDSLDPFRNLAMEEYLLDAMGGEGDVSFALGERHGFILFLWRSANAVIIGKNQNPWRECNLRRLDEEKAALARRLSGGGAVFHDAGNLNYAFILPRAQYDSCRQLCVVIKAMEQLGIHAQVAGKNSLAVGGLKVSGNAFSFRRTSAMHHGTLLVSTDLERMDRFLRVSPSTLRTRAIASVPASVTNLSAVVPSLTVDVVGDALAMAARHEYGEELREVSLMSADAARIKQLTEKYASWSWRFGLTPDFEMDVTGEALDETVTLRVNVKDGLIAEISALIGVLPRPVLSTLIGSQLECGEIRRRLQAVLDAPEATSLSQLLCEAGGLG